MIWALICGSGCFSGPVEDRVIDIGASVLLVGVTVFICHRMINSTIARWYTPDIASRIKTTMWHTKNAWNFVSSWIESHNLARGKCVSYS